MLKSEKYKMVIAPFIIVPQEVVFRYKGEWWRRIRGTKYQAIKFVEEEFASGDNTAYIGSDEPVALAKNLITKESDKLFFIEEFDLCLKEAE